MNDNSRVSAPGHASVSDRLKALALAPLPQHLLTRVVYALTRRRSHLVTPVIRRFAAQFKVDMQDALQSDLTAYETFNAFFTRALKPEARPLAPGDDVIACPADGRISAIGRIRDARILQAKGIDYSLLELLGGDGEATEILGDGSFVTVYLSPRDYHRLHMPASGQLLSQVHVPGRLWSVGPHAVRALDGLFTRNERVIAQFETRFGRMALVLVGAMNVAAIDTVWQGPVTPNSRSGITRKDYTEESSPITLERGAEMGRFNMGSTIIAVFERRINWTLQLQSETAVLMGQALGAFSASD